MARPVQSVEEYVAKKLAAAPRLSDEQRLRLTGLLQVEKRQASG